MFYQGEDIAINVKFDEEVLASATKFTLLVYPSFNIKREAWAQEVATTAITDGQHTFNIPYTVTKGWSIGSYTIEILMQSGSGDGETRSIYQKESAFQLKFSKAKDVDNGTSNA